MIKRRYLTAFFFITAGLMVTSAGVAAESAQAFRQENGLLAYAPPAWFLEGYFIAREKQPIYVFGPTKEFVGILGGTTAWLIEDLELERLKRVSSDGNKPEYTLFLEVVYPESLEYWVFVVLPHETAQAWFEARRAYHGRKAEAYYGETQRDLERALNQGLTIKAELRFLIEKAEPSLQPPEDLIMSRYKFQPIYDLKAGRWMRPAAGNQ
jgi:hypothetical protein